MKNDKGQVLVLFILILPIVMLGVCCVIDSSYMLYQKNRLDNINRDVLESLKKSDNVTEKDVKDLIYMNDKEIVNDDITIDESITIDNHKMVHSIFGKLIGIDEYKITSNKDIKLDKHEEIVLDIDSINSYDNTNRYIVNNKNVLYNDGLIFNNSYLLINNFKINDKFRIELSFVYNGDGIIIKFNDFIVNIINNELLVNNINIYPLIVGTINNLVIENDKIILNNVEIPMNYKINNNVGNLIVGYKFVGKMNFIKIYDLGE